MTSGQKKLPHHGRASIMRLGKFSFTRKTPGMKYQMARRGMTDINLIAEWNKIIGPALARYSVPEGIKNISGQKVLYIKVFETRIIEYQHQKSDILKRVNMTAGFHFVDDLKLIRVIKLPKSRFDQKPQYVPFPKETHSYIDNHQIKFKDESLKRAFSNLAHAILPKKQTTDHNEKNMTKQTIEKSWVVQAKKILNHKTGN